LFANCTSQHERQKKSEDKLKEQLLTTAYQVRELEKKIEDCDAKKTLFVAQRKLKEAKEVVRERFKLAAKLPKLQSLHEFTSSLLEQISDTATLKDTMLTLHEAQTVFKSIDAPKVYRRFDKLSEQYTIFRDQVAETQEMVNSRVGDVNTGVSAVDDSELNAELEALEAAMSLSAASDLPAVPVSSQPLGTVTARAYSKAGLI
jgi:GTP1/Obg family GTP-binding protein